jgi:hypothetical protein
LLQRRRGLPIDPRLQHEQRHKRDRKGAEHGPDSNPKNLRADFDAEHRGGLRRTLSQRHEADAAEESPPRARQE